MTIQIKVTEQYFSVAQLVFRKHFNFCKFKFSVLICFSLATVEVGSERYCKCCFLPRLPVSTVKTLIAEHGTLYKQVGMKPKYTGYIPRKLSVTSSNLSL